MKREIKYITLVLGTMLLQVANAQHFQTVWTGNAIAPMNIYVNECTFNGESTQAGDEIAVYDGTLCVGVIVLNGPVVAPEVIVASKDDALGVPNGFTPGNTIDFRFYKKSLDKEYSLGTFGSNVSHLSGSFFFAEGGTKVVKITAQPTNTQPVAAIDSATITVNEGEQFQLDGSGSTDPDGDQLRYLWSLPADILPLSANVDSSVDLMAGEVSSDVSRTVWLIVDDGALQGTQSCVVTIKNVNKAPELLTTPELFVVEGQMFTYIIRTQDEENDAVSFSVLEKPGWMSVSNDTITGIPHGADADGGNLVVEIDDGVTSREYSFSIQVIPVNDPPVFESVPVISVDEDGLYSYSVVVSDEDMDSLTIAPILLPDWLSYDEGSKILASRIGHPNDNDVGVHQVILGLSDGRIKNPIKQSFQIIVNNINDAPQLSTVKDSVAVEEGNRFEIMLFAVDSDKYDKLKFEGIALPGWLTLDQQDNYHAKIFGMPGNEQVGTHQLEFKVTDLAGQSATLHMKLTVLNINDRPYFGTDPVTSVVSGSLYTYNIQVSDADVGDNIGIECLQKPSWLTFTDNGNGTATLTGTHVDDGLGYYLISLKATDGVITDSVMQDYAISVNKTNTAPVFTSTAVTSAREGRLYNYYITAEDAEGNGLQFSSDVLPAWLDLSNKGSGSALLSGIPMATDTGDLAITLSVTDGIAAKVEQKFTLHVYRGTTLPAFKTDTLQKANAGILYAGSIDIEDSDSGIVSAKAFIINQPDLPWLSIVGATNGYPDIPGVQYADINLVNGKGTINFTGIPGLGDVGIKYILVGIDDGLLKHYKRYKVEVLEADIAPIVDDQQFTVNEDKMTYLTLMVKDNSPASALIYEILTPPDGIAGFYNNNIFYYKSMANVFGLRVDSMVVQVTDPDGNSAQAKVVLDITNVNDRPVLKSVQDRYSLEQGDSVMFNLYPDDNTDKAEAATDLRLRILYGPFNGTVDTTNYGSDSIKVKYKPNASFTGKDMLVARVQEGAAGLMSLPVSVSFEVSEKNTAPVSYNDSVFIREDELETIALRAEDNEDILDDLQFVITQAPAHAKVFSLNGNRVQYQPVANMSGTDTIKFMAGDTQGGISAESMVIVRISAVNDMPVVANDTIDILNDGNRIDFSKYIWDVEDSDNLDTLELEFIYQNADSSPRGIFASKLTAVAGGNGYTYDYTYSHNQNYDFIAYRVMDADSMYSDPGVIVIRNLNVSSPNPPGGTSDTVQVQDELQVSLAWGDVVGLSLPATNGTSDQLNFRLTNSQGDAVPLNGTTIQSEEVIHAIGSPFTYYKLTYAAMKSTSVPVTYDTVYYQAYSSTDTAMGKVCIHTYVNNVAPLMEPVGDITMDEGTSTEITVKFTDPDTEGLYAFNWDYSFSNLDMSLNVDTLRGVDSMKFTITPPVDFYGSIGARIRVIDTDGLSDEVYFNIKVNNINDAPQILAWNKGAQNEYFSIQDDQVVNATVIVTDSENDSITFSATWDPLNSIDSVVFRSNTMTVFPSGLYVDTLRISVTATDNGTPAMASAPQLFKIAQQAVNTYPQLPEPDVLSLFEDGQGSFKVTPADADGDQVTLKVTNMSPGLITSASVDIATDNSGVERTITVVPVADKSGIGNILLTAIDALGDSVCSTVGIWVKPLNDAPVLEDMDTIFLDEESVAYMPIIANDKDSEELTYEVSDTTAGISVGIKDYVLMVTALENYNGISKATLVVTDDSSSSVEKSVVIVVNNVNDAPMFTSKPQLYVYAYSGYTYHISASDNDPNDTLVYSAKGLPQWLGFTDNGDGTALLSGTTYAEGTFPVSIVLSDGHITDSIVQEFAVNVLPVKLGTDVLSACDSLTWINGVTYTADNDTSTYLIHTASGIDSLVTLNLTVVKIDNTIIKDGSTLTASEVGAGYQWLDCSDFSQVANETGQAFTPTVSGSYAVEITKGQCVDTSDCMAVTTTGGIENIFSNNVMLYPNPVQDNINVLLGRMYDEVIVTVYSEMGIVVMQRMLKNVDRFKLELPVPAGMYFVEVKSKNEKALYKVVKE